MMTTISMHQYHNEIETKAYLHNDGVGPGCWLNIDIGESHLTIHFDNVDALAALAWEMAKHAERLLADIKQPAIA